MNEHPELDAGDMLEIQSHPAYRLGYEHGWDDAPRKPAPRRRDRLGIVAVAAAGLALLLVGIAIGRADAAPRSVLPTTPSPGVSVAIGSVDAPARVRPGTSAGPTGAPQTASMPREPTDHRPDSTTTSGAPASAGSAGRIGSPLEGVRGVASWYGTSGPGIYAAAGPPLRVGHWRGRVVTVCGNGSCVAVRLTDWCACPKRAIDLSADAFRQLAPLRQGLVVVTVTWGGSAAPPATDR